MIYNKEQYKATESKTKEQTNLDIKMRYQDAGDTNSWALKKALVVTAWVQAKSAAIKFIAWAATTAALYFWLAPENKNQSWSQDPDNVKEWLDKYHAKETVVEEKRKQGCGNLHEEELHAMRGIEQYFASWNDELARLLRKGLDANTKEKVLSITFTNEQDHYLDTIIIHKTKNNLYKCLSEIHINLDSICLQPNNNSVERYKFQDRVNSDVMLYRYPSTQKVVLSQDIYDFPEELLILPKLKYLELRDGYLLELPESIWNLSTLEELEITGHKDLKSLPNTIGNLYNLKVLDLSANNLKSIPETIWNLSNLEKLMLWHNFELETLPETIWNLSNLKELGLNNNELRSPLPESFVQLTKLTHLELSCALEELPEDFWNLSNLEELNLYYNHLKILPESFYKLSNLKVLNLGGNPLNKLSESIGNLSQLTHLYLDETELTTIPEAIYKLPNLVLLDLSGTSLTQETRERLKTTFWDRVNL